MAPTTTAASPASSTDQPTNSPTEDFLKRVYNDPYVITLDEVGDFKH